PETNVRTYVLGPDGERGIWFFTLEAGRLFAALGARSLYGLPYRWSAMRVTTSRNAVHYTSRRHRPSKPARSQISVQIGESIHTSNLASFLTAKFRLYTLLHGNLAC